MNAIFTYGRAGFILRILVAVLVLSELVSCSQAPRHVPGVLDGDSIIDMISRLDESTGSPAINTLFQKSTQYFRQQKWEQARYELDRALRIEPKHASTWTRMALLSLKTGSMDQAKNMAYRSNSLASGVVDLETINWRIISEACKKRSDSACMTEAQSKLNQLID